ncbi:hypothetical protein J2Z21_007613 [Streptomyces griseochromogenes]|uniref:Uncharacterized protein n=1 Tax=Streptomyces griseochromogenes TaxID=68214 RepID=A0ABS4M5A1_9ACTN|nr:hypothetical protein [Streptomyces griseochromogenes]
MTSHRHGLALLAGAAGALLMIVSAPATASAACWQARQEPCS